MRAYVHAASVVVMLTLGCRDKSGSSIPLRVAAAADVAAIIEAKVKPLWTSGPLEVISGSSGLLAKQIREGAPYDVFLSADEATVTELLKSNACLPSSQRHYARGALAVITAEGISLPARIEDLTNSAYRRIAIANPQHAPYGRAAQQILKNAKLDEALTPRLVFAQNVSQAVQLVRTGNADAALVSRTLAGSTSLKIDPSLHEALIQTAVSCAPEARKELADQFLKLLISEPVQHEFQTAGLLPVENEAPR